MTTADRLAFVAAVRANPECHVTRGAFADWLDEQEVRRVPCPKCEDRIYRCGEKYNPAKGPPSVPGTGDPVRWKLPDCDGTGTVPDTEDSDRAECLRLGVEECRCTCSRYHDRIRTCARCARLRDLAARLTPASWPCPECKATGKVYYADSRVTAGQLWSGDYCPACNGNGDLLRAHDVDEALLAEVGREGAWELDRTRATRPLPVQYDAAHYPRCVTVPTLADAVEPCPECSSSVESGWVHRHGESGPGYYTCKRCADIDNGERRGSGYVPTHRLRALYSVPPWGVPLEAVVPADRVPTQNPDEGVFLFNWYRGPGPIDGIDMQHVLPPPVWELLDAKPHPTFRGWKTYPTPDAATLALGKAIFAFGRGASV